MFTPRRPTLAATGLLIGWVAILSLPMLGGKFLSGPYSDQLATGYAYRAWAAEQVLATGHVPQWNPEIFGGLPFVAAQHGDIFYPTALLRLVLPTATAMNLGFAIHYIAAGLLLYAFLRLLGVSWAGAVTGGLAYQLSGVVASLVQPGHDGKLFVSALLPLMLIGLLLALRRGRWEGFALLAFAVGLGLFAHVQTVYYSGIAAGLFALYLTFGEPEGQGPIGNRYAGLGLSLAAVAVGLGIAAIQLLPFFAYLPYSPRAAGYAAAGGATDAAAQFRASAMYAIPWNHVPEFFIADFVGSRTSYWGTNPLKFHSEYLGLPVVALALLGAATPGRRKLVWWLGGIGLLFLLVSMGAATPFYRLWWSVMPFVSKTRAPGMAFFIVAMVVSIFAAFGVSRLEQGEGGRAARGWMIAGGVIAVLGLSGAIGGLAASLAQGNSQIAAQWGVDPVAAAKELAPALRLHAATSGVSLALLGIVAWAFGTGRIRAPVLAVGIALVVSGDLWRNGAGFWSYTDEHKRMYGSDQILDYIKRSGDDSSKVMNVPEDPPRIVNFNVYPGSSLMAHDVPELLGHHGMEIRFFDELMGGRNVWNNLGNGQLWDLFAIRWVVFPDQPGTPDTIPGFKKVLSGVATAGGGPGKLFERLVPPRYGRVVPAAVKVNDQQAVATVLDQRFAVDRVVVIAEDAAFNPKPFTQLPEPIPSTARVSPWAPGRMTVTIDPAPPGESYLVVSENYAPGWTATVNGVAAPVGRGNGSLVTVALPAGASEVQLEFRSPGYDMGRMISWLAFALVLAGLGVPAMRRRMLRA